MTFDLVNITTLNHLTQLEGRIPGFISQQFSLLIKQWTIYLSEVTKSLEDDDLTQLRDIVHKMKGHTGILGLSALSNRLAELEQELHDQTFTPHEAPLVQELDLIMKQSLEALDRLRVRWDDGK